MRKQLVIACIGFIIFTLAASTPAIANIPVIAQGGNAEGGTTKVSLIINEFMASNDNCVQDPQGDYDDWIEIYNAGEGDMDVGGMYITDNLSDPAKYQIPANLSETTIPAGEYLLIWIDGDADDSPGLHTDFRLNADGEEIGLFDNSENLIDSVRFDAWPADMSLGRYPDAGENWRIFDVPTPGEANHGGYEGIIADPEFSPDHGFYEDFLDVSITCETEGATIYYTVDGTAPDNTGTEYTKPIPIKDTTYLRARAFKPGWLTSTITTHTYLFDVSEEIKSLPVVSLVGDEEESFYEPNGIMAIVGGHYGDDGAWVPDNPGDYNNPTNRGLDYERPISCELIQPEDHTGFQRNCGIRVHGSAYTRPRYRRGDDWAGYNKFSFNLYFRTTYGDKWLEYPLFPSFRVERFRRLVLRGGHNDRTNPFITDELVRRLHKDMGYVSSGGMIVNLFINGEYKGYYNLCEHIDQEFCQEWYRSEEDWDIIVGREVSTCTNEAWNTLLDKAYNYNLSDKANYEEVSKLLDIEAFIDYLILQIYVSNDDWPRINWAVARERTDDGLFRFYVWDAESCMLPECLYTTPFEKLNTENERPIGRLYQALRVNDNFRKLFADRIKVHFYNNGALTDTNIEKRFLELRDEMSGVLPDMEMFIPYVFIPERHDIAINAFAQEGLLPWQTTSSTTMPTWMWTLIGIGGATMVVMLIVSIRRSNP